MLAQRYAPFLFGLYRNVSEIISEILNKAIKVLTLIQNSGSLRFTILCIKRENQCGKEHVIVYNELCFSVSFSTLWANSADDKLMISFLSFPRK